jgi:hypothetical protein
VFIFVVGSYPGTTQWLREPGSNKQPFAECNDHSNVDDLGADGHSSQPIDSYTG